MAVSVRNDRKLITTNRVDDGSSDRTLEALEAEAAHDARIVVVALSRNFGHQAALTAALDHCSGDAVVVMDADLQDPPEVIPRFVEKHRDGYDVVYAMRASTEGSMVVEGSRIFSFTACWHCSPSRTCRLTLAISA